MKVMGKYTEKFASKYRRIYDDAVFLSLVDWEELQEIMKQHAPEALLN